MKKRKDGIFILVLALFMGQGDKITAAVPEEKNQTPFVPAYGSEIGAGYFIPGDNEVREKYDCGPTPYIGLKYTFSPDWSIVGDIGYWRGSNDKNSLKIMPLTLTGLYTFPLKGKILRYAGGGVSLYFAEKKAVDSESDSKTAFGPHILTGLTLPVSDRVFLGIEGKYSYTKVSDWDMNIGGVSLSIVTKIVFPSTSSSIGGIKPTDTLRYDYVQRLCEYLEKSNNLVCVNKNTVEKVLLNVNLKIDKARCDKEKAVALTTQGLWHQLWGLTIYLPDVPVNLKDRTLLDEYIHAASESYGLDLSDVQEHLFRDYIEVLCLWANHYHKKRGTAYKDKADSLLSQIQQHIGDKKIKEFEIATGLSMGEHNLSK